ncbi:MAG: two-component system sensor histidine kinase NtrB, partial [Gallionellaceae bacterium CG_4_10_14_3_um_filter_60_1069]
MTNAALPTLEYLATAVMLLDEQSRIAFLNPAAEHL